MANKMNDFEKLKRKRLPELRSMAKKEGLPKVSIRWKRAELARRILEHRKLKELDSELDKQTKEPEVAAQRNLVFEQLAGVGDTESAPEPAPAPESAPDQEPAPESGPGRGGFRPGAGRPQGMTDKLARARRSLENTVPNPGIEFLIKKFFGAWQNICKDVPEIELTKEESEKVSLPLTNLVQYYFPGLKITPVLELWFLTYMVLDETVSPRIKKVRVKRAETPELDAEQLRVVNAIGQKIITMSPDQRDKAASMLGVELTKEVK